LRENVQERIIYYNTDKCDKLKELKSNLDEVKESLLSNLDKVIERGEKIDVLVDKT